MISLSGGCYILLRPILVISYLKRFTNKFNFLITIFILQHQRFNFVALRYDSTV